VQASEYFVALERQIGVVVDQAGVGELHRAIVVHPTALTRNCRSSDAGCVT
jgi:hypothetical protein